MATYDYITSSGTIIADTSGLQSEIQSEWQGVFGSDLAVTSDTPQGLIITTDTLARSALVNNNAAVANQINPNLAGGVFLDAIMSFLGITRNAATQSLVPNVTLSGVSGTVIPQGTQCQTAAGDLFASASAVTIPSGGSITVNFYSVAYGAIPCAIGALNTIVTGVIGLETVTNATAATLGTTTQSDVSALAYRNNTLSFQGVSTTSAIISALYNVPNVSNVNLLQNRNSYPLGELIKVSSGTTLSNTIWGLVTSGAIVIDTTAQVFAQSTQALPAVNPFPIANYSTTGNVTLSGLGTQSGGDWASTLTAGNIILVKNNTTASQNGLWVAASGAWTRQTYNTSATTIQGAINGCTLIKNSIYPVLLGGASTPIAAAILENISMGCGWNGNQSVALIEPAGGQTETVLFDYATSINIQVAVTTTNGNITNIQQAVIDYFATLTIGQNVSAFEISAQIIKEYPAYYIENVQICVLGGTLANTPVTIYGNQIAVTYSTYITVNVVSS